MELKNTHLSLKKLSLNQLNHSFLKRRFKFRNDVQIGGALGFGFFLFCLFVFTKKKGKSPKGINYTLNFLKILSQALENHEKQKKKECDLVQKNKTSY